MNITQRTILYVLIIIAVTAFLEITAPARPYEAHGIFLPVTKSLPAINANQVKLYRAPPANYTLLGRVNVEMHFTHKPTEQTAVQLENKARQLAAEHGANGLVISQFGYTPPGTTESSGLLVYLLHAEAVRVK